MPLKFKVLSRTPPGVNYIEPSTGFRVDWITSIQEVFERVAEHRIAHGIPLEDGWKERVEEQMAGRLRVPDPENWVYDPDNPPLTFMVRTGRSLWHELHDYALRYPQSPDEVDKQAALRWFASWEERIPMATCACRENWRAMGLGQPDVSSRRAFYEWTCMAHDRVNEKLGKPLQAEKFMAEYPPS